jgi:class 3 adenylate cyclase/predicted ATPase
LVGSTALAARLDPEDLREVIGAYHRRVAKVVGRYDGFVAKYMGDGVLIYFGYPQAHEDDAERAVRAGLKLVATMDKLPTRTEVALQARVGIATGLVVVGDLIGAGEAQERGIVGETPNLAARLQGIAEPNTVVIAEGTRKLLGNLFELQDLGPKDLKGISGPVPVWSPLRAGSAEGRFEAMHAAGVTELVGREEELELLLRRWSRAKTGEGQVVLLSGEAGIGKSRLTAALEETLQADPHTRLRYFCSPYHTDSALYPVLSQLERAAGFERDNPPEAKLSKLEALLAPAGPQAEDVALMADLMSIPTLGRYATPALSPQRKKEKTLEALLGQLEGLARRRPVLMIFEDVHWVDPTSRELLDLMVERAPRSSLLLIITFRPEFPPSWTGLAHVTLLTLARLDRRAGASLVQRIVGNQHLPDEVVEEIVERTDGVPLFVEELTKAVAEAAAGAPEAAGKVISTTVRPVHTVPATLHASLMARLDRLGPMVKEVAQIGAAIGREFSDELINAVAARHTGKGLPADLDRLVDAGLLFRCGMPPQSVYLFKHALVQDAAYGTLLRGPRQELHTRIAAVLEERFPLALEHQPARLAQHCTEAGLVEKAVAYWGQAGRQSLTRSAVTEALSQLGKGLDLVAGRLENPERWRLELPLQSALSMALAVSRGVGSNESWEALTRARELCERLDETSVLRSVVTGQFNNAVHRRGPAEALRVAEEYLLLARRLDDVDHLLLAHRHMGYSLWVLGRFAEGREHSERVLALYDPERHRSMVHEVGFDYKISALTALFCDLFILGYPDQAVARVDETLSWSQDLRHPHARAIALIGATMLNIMRGADETAEPLLEEAIGITTEQKFPLWLAIANGLRGDLLARRHRLQEGVALARRGLVQQRATGSTVWQTYYLSLLAQSCEAVGQPGEALQALTCGLAMVDRTGERWFEAELHRQKGEWIIACREEERAEAERCFHRALEIARSQKAKMWELRAANSLARLWRDEGRGAEAHALLAPIYGWFTEGFAMPDLQEAKALLDELAEPS